MARSCSRAFVCFAACLPLCSALTLGRAEARSHLNPIRKVVTLLQKMQKKVDAQAVTAESLYTKFQCYCQNSGGDLSASIAAADSKIPELMSALKAAESRKQQLGDDLASHQKDRASAKAAVAEATALRAKEKGTFDKDLADGRANLEAVKKAAAAISAGMGSFLQTVGASTLRSIVVSRQDMPEVDRQEVLSFLSNQQQGEYAPASGEILGILKQMADEMAAAQEELIGTEHAAIESFEALMTAKKKEIASLSASIEGKMTRAGEIGVEIATMQNDIGDTSDNLAADKKFAANLKGNCDEKAGLHEKEKLLRAAEVVALADTIKILNDDDALDLFKKTLPSASASFLQLQETSGTMRREVQKVLTSARIRTESRHRPRLDFILLALNGKKEGLGKIVSLIDELVVSLKAEQGDDDNKKEFCGHQIDQSEDEVKSLTNAISDKQTAVDDAKEQSAKLAEEIGTLKAGIVALDKAVATATEMRSAESAEYKELMTSNTAAKELILFAKNRLNQFYNPKLYKAPPKRQLSEGDQIYENEGGDIPASAPGGIANTGIGFVQLSSRQDRSAPPPPPATAAAYTKKAQESNGVMAMMDLLVKDLDKELTEAEVEEKNGQEEYEQTVADSAEKRRGDSKTLTDKDAANADLKALLDKFNSKAKGLGKELMGASKYLSNLHGECDWLVQYYDVRKQARADEIDSLGKAKAVLSGADYSLVQRSSRVHTHVRHF